MDEQDKKPSGAPETFNRRTFLGVAGLAASAAFLGPLSKLSGDSSYFYLNSFGESVPVSQDLIDLGVYPPPFPEGFQSPDQPELHGRRSSIDSFERRDRPMDDPANTPTGPVKGYPFYNILLVMVDQLRTPRWVPAGGSGLATLQALTPNITKLQTQSFSFPNFFVAATACTPSRSTLLTGLYTQQTCQFRTQDTPGCEPSLNIGFQNIATVLGQSFLGMPSFWVGKWHLSDPTPTLGSAMGANGPTDYSFSAGAFGGASFPPSSSIASPNGGGNTGSEGYNPSNHPTHSTLPPNSVSLGSLYYNDAAICDYFFNKTVPALQAVPSANRWFAAVSFVNPHDVTQFPFSYNLSGLPNFGSFPTNFPTSTYPPPFTTGSSGSGATNSQIYADTSLPPLPSAYSTGGAAVGANNWNYADGPTRYNGGLGKPDMQLAFQGYINNMYGQCDGSVVSWNTFMNYYFWMQACVDFQIGRILYPSPPTSLLNEAVVVFLSDHGDYGGSHNLHAKGGALYDEAINVPLYVSYPPMRPASYANGNGPFTIPYVCSMVDVLPFFYAQSLGSDAGWRRDTASNVAYLSNRESILDSIYAFTNSAYLNAAQQRRVSSIPNQNGNYNNQPYQPYILTTTDEFATAAVNGTLVPPHAVGFRTVDLTVPYRNADGVNVFGGGKLGIYSFWPSVPSSPTSSNVNQTLTQPNMSLAQQYEFYDYTGAVTGNRNYPELGNEWLSNPLNSVFLAAFNNIAVQNELYPPNAYTTSLYNAFYQAALLSYAIARNNTTC